MPPKAHVPSKKRGQLFSSELVIASGFFIIAIVIFYMTYTSLASAYYEEQQDTQMQSVLLGISDSLVLSPGDPANWEASAKENASSFGLAYSPNRLSESKIAALQSLNSSYQTVRVRMGAGAYDLYLSVSNSTSVLYSFGLRANSSNSLVQSLSNERLALLNDSTVQVYVQVWRTKGRLA